MCAFVLIYSNPPDTFMTVTISLDLGKSLKFPIRYLTSQSKQLSPSSKLVNNDTEHDNLQNSSRVTGANLLSFKALQKKMQQNVNIIQ